MVGLSLCIKPQRVTHRHKKNMKKKKKIVRLQETLSVHCSDEHVVGRYEVKLFSGVHLN